MSPDPLADAFVRGILRQPDDTTARLVFADWLDERGDEGDAAWAQYLRAQVEAVKHPAGTLARREQQRLASAAVSHVTARLTVPAELFVQYPHSLINLLPPSNLAVSLADFDTPQEVVEYIPESVARENTLLPLAMQERTILVAMADPCNGDLVQKLDFILNRDTIAVGCDAAELREAIDRHYGNTETEVVDSILVQFTDTASGPTRTGPAAEPWDDAAPVSRLVAVILGEALGLRADRVHIAAEPDCAVILFRIGGEWVERDRHPVRLLRPLVQRVVYLCDVWRTYPLNQPFDGRFRCTHRGLAWEVGVAITAGTDPTVTFDLPDRYTLPDVADVPVP